MNTTLTEMVFEVMIDMRPWTYWNIGQEIHRRHGQFFNDNSISAAIRNLRKQEFKAKLNIKMDADPVIKERIPGKRGYTYRLSPMILSGGNS
tara:strand:- start:133 stop:408 length:276 start_codon:yes stop_codon:yes gene_type:complete